MEGHTLRSRSQGQKCWKGLVTRNTHVKFENPIPYHSKDMAKIKVFFLTDGQTDGLTGFHVPVHSRKRGTKICSQMVTFYYHFVAISQNVMIVLTSTANTVCLQCLNMPYCLNKWTLDTVYSFLFSFPYKQNLDKEGF